MNEMNGSCDKAKAISIVTFYLRENRLYREGLSINATKLSDTSISIVALPKDTFRLGGGGEFVVSWPGCDIVEVQLYQ